MFWFRAADGRLRIKWRLLGPVALIIGWAAATAGIVSDMLLTRLETGGGAMGGERLMLVGSVMAILMITLIVLGLILSYDLAGPLRSMVDAAGAFVQGDYGRRLDPSSIHELNVISGAMNQMAQQMQAQMVELRQQAFYDPLTGLPNRALFLDRLHRALSRARRKQTAVAVMYLDLDNFKLVNDSLGHKAGDELLVHLGQRIQACLRTGDSAARLGGDEFTVLLEQLADVGDVVRVAERILDQLRGPVVVGGQEMYAGLSIGITICAAGAGEPGDLLREADVAMYRAKRQGKGSYAIFNSSMEAHVTERLAIETDLRRAVERNEFIIHYQPIVGLDDDEIEGVEALLRWEHPQRGLLLPHEFLAVAEETGMIVPIGRWVMREACHQLRTWQLSLPDRRPLGLSVNLSVRQFNDPLLVNAIMAILHETGLDPSSLTLEITETAAMEDGEAAVTKLRALKMLGVRLAMDDFGTGFSALSYLKRFPMDMIKIDQSFTRGLGTVEEDTAIVRAAIAFAKSLSLRVTTEGIETPEQLAWVRRLGSNCGQGFHFARPMCAAAIGQVFASQQRALVERRAVPVAGGVVAV